MKEGLKIRAILSFIFIALFYALSKLMKASLSPLVTIFINNNILSSAQIAALASIFYLVAGLMCIPAGMIVAKIGVKKSYIASALLLFFGTLLFAFSNSYFYFILHGLLPQLVILLFLLVRY
jgi:MFS family permease